MNCHQIDELLALNTVTNYGYKKGKPLFFGIFAGYYVVQILCAIFVYGVNSLLPNVMEVMKYIGAAYILILSILVDTFISKISFPMQPGPEIGSISDA